MCYCRVSVRLSVHYNLFFFWKGSQRRHAQNWKYITYYNAARCLDSSLSNNSDKLAYNWLCRYKLQVFPRFHPFGAFGTSILMVPHFCQSPPNHWILEITCIPQNSFMDICRARGLNTEDAMDRSRWRKQIGIIDVWSWCKWFAYGPADATATQSSLVSVKSRMVYLSGASLHRLSWKKGHVCVCVCVWSPTETLANM